MCAGWCVSQPLPRCLLKSTATCPSSRRPSKHHLSSASALITSKLNAALLTWLGKVAKMRAAGLWGFHLFVLTRQVKQPLLYLGSRSYFFLVSNDKICLHSSTSLYVVWLLNESGLEDGKCPICCVFNGWILELQSYSGRARMEQTAPICWPLQGENTVFQLASTSFSLFLSASVLTRVHQHYAQKKLTHVGRGAQSCDHSSVIDWSVYCLHQPIDSLAYCLCTSWGM